MSLRPGSLVTVAFPFTDLSAVKRRPALVLVTAGEDLVLCGVTSRRSGRRNAVSLGLDDMAEGRLPRASEVRPRKLFTIHRSLVHRVVGGVRDKTLAEVVGLLVDALHAGTSR